MRVLFVGLGSIGQRNLDSCLRVRPNYEYAALRHAKNPARDGIVIREFFDLHEVDNFKPELIWICNPTSLHAETIENFKKYESCFFIEKPLAGTTADVNRIHELLIGKKNPFFYGCLLRFHPLIKRVRELISNQCIGTVKNYELFCGSYLPDWRKNIDYRTTYSAKKSMGGGVTFDLIHEFDYADFWFGAFRNISGFKAHVSSLEIDSDDLCRVESIHNNGVTGKIELNYFRRETKRDFKIRFSNGHILGDLVNGDLTITTHTGLVTKENYFITREDLHDQQSLFIFKTIEERLDCFWDLGRIKNLMLQVIDIPFISSAPEDIQ